MRRMTGIVMKRLIENLAKEIPEMMIEEVSRKTIKIKLERDDEITGRAPDQEEDCLMLLGGLNLNKGKEEVASGAGQILTEMSKLNILEEKNYTAKVNDEGGVEEEWLDFSDPEDEKEALELLERAEKELMIEFKLSEQTEGQTSQAVELACQEKKILGEQTEKKDAKMSEQTDGQTSQPIELACQEIRILSEQTTIIEMDGPEKTKTRSLSSRPGRGSVSTGPPTLSGPT